MLFKVLLRRSAAGDDRRPLTDGSLPCPDGKERIACYGYHRDDRRVTNALNRGSTTTVSITLALHFFVRLPGLVVSVVVHSNPPPRLPGEVTEDTGCGSPWSRSSRS
jgi:hypothetical protein